MTTLFPRLAFADDGPAISVGDRALSYRQLRDACAAHAADLRDAGVEAGDLVGVVADADADTIVAIVGNLLAGVVTVPLDPKLGERELRHVLVDAKPRRVYGARPSAAPPALTGRVQPIRATKARGDLRARHDAAAPAFVLYTSGTTGAPKGAVITHGNVAANLDALALAWRWTDRDRLVQALPLFHVHGLILGILGPLRVGASVELLPRFDPASVARALDSGASMVFGVPTMYHRLADAAERDASVARALGRARLLVSGSAPLSVREHARIERVAGRGVHERYGLTETLIDCAVPAWRPPRPGYVGPPLDGVELRLVSDERTTIDASDDETMGEVAVRSPSVFAGYFKRPDATHAILDAGGWLYTGDLATRAPDGAIRIVGRRATDLIKTGGFRVGAGEVEGAIREIEGVDDVAVVGLPDDDLGERIVAFVVARRDAALVPKEIEDRVAHALSPHKRPREIRFVDALPRNAMGKVQKKDLR